MAATLALACGGEEPAPTLRPLAPAQPPTTAPTPTPVPTATPLPESVGICYRTPEVQEWIIQQLQIPSCRVITEPELYRITDQLYVNAQLKPGDLAGLVNVPAFDIDYGHCGDWESPEYAAAVLDGLNPEARITINASAGYPPPGDWPRGEIYRIFLSADSVAEAQRQIGSGIHETEIDRLGEARMERLKQDALALKEQVNDQAIAISEAVKEAQGITESVSLESLGVAVIGKDTDNIERSRVYVRVETREGGPYPECAE